MSLVVSKITFSYAQERIWRYTYDFSASPGEIVGISGKSGSGKSTLLDLIAGFLLPQSGTIRFNDQDLLPLAPGKRPVSFLFQRHNLFEHLSAFDNVALGRNPSLRLSARDRARIMGAFAAVDLAGFEHRVVARLSGGQQQRVALARSLVRNAPIQLLDEPFSGLDRATQDDMLVLVADLARQTNRLVLLVSHDERDITRIADRHLVMHEGRLHAAARRQQ